MMTVQQRYELIRREFNDVDSLLRAIGMFQAMTRRVFPNAVLLATTAENGVETHIGVYNVALQLTPRGYFKRLHQPASQLLGERIRIGSSIYRLDDNFIRYTQELSCWITALHHALLIKHELIILGNDYVSTITDKTITTKVFNSLT